MTTYDPVTGIPRYEESDLAAPGGEFSDLLNLLADATNLELTDQLTAIGTVTAALAARNVWTTTGAAAAFSGFTVGTGGTIQHRWRILDGIFEAHFEILMGSGFSLAPGMVYTLPAGYKTAPIITPVCGDGWMEDVSAGNRYATLCPLPTTSGPAVNIRHRNGGIFAQAISNTAPFTWAAGDTVKGYVRVPVVPV